MSIIPQAKSRTPAVTEAISALLVQQPFFASLVLDLLKIEETTTIPNSVDPLRTSATDGQTLWINPVPFAKLNIHERVALLAHEVMHVILQHNTRLHMYMALGVGPDLKQFSPKKFNHACDYIINAYLIKAGFKLPLGSLQNSQVTENDIVDEVYLKLPDDEDDEDSPDGIDNHVEGDPQTAPAKATVQAAMKKAEEISKMQGKGTGMHKRLIDDICETQVPWHEVLRKAMTTITRGRDTYTWARPNRRKLAMAPHIYWPGRAGWKGPHIAVEIDTSGSISDAEISTFLGELSGILTDLEPEMVYVMYVDDSLQGDVIEIDDVNQLQNVREKSKGGGGTDMTVVFDVIREKQLPVETVVVFTDGYTPFGTEEDAGIPTVWCITNEKQAD
jgi:predicted metal-dependent peptidase